MQKRTLFSLKSSIYKGLGQGDDTDVGVVLVGLNLKMRINKWKLHVYPFYIIYRGKDIFNRMVKWEKKL